MSGAGNEVRTPDHKNAAQARRSLIVEGWRFLAHSYAIVNQWQLLALLRRSDVAVRVVDVPFSGKHWQAQNGLFEPQADEALRSMEVAEPDASADVTLRVSFPFDFSLSRSRETVVFATSENQLIRKDQLRDLQAYDDLQRMPRPKSLKVVTPSRWSAEGFYKAGFTPEQVYVVPHGVDVGTFRPMPHLRNQIRRTIPIPDSDFVFLSVGAMSGNKGIDLLLQAFAQVCQKAPHARLVLKGMDSLYKSQDFLLRSMQTVPAQHRQRAIERITYFGKSFPFREIAKLYQASDVYVSPYRAEGFNIPVLEAAACGIPVICTRGGATDDFVTDAFARRIDSERRVRRYNGQDLTRLEPKTEHLTALMLSAVEDDVWRKQAAEAGCLHVRANYGWDRVVDTLVGKLFP